MLAAELIAKYIADTGTDAVFGIAGEGNLAIITAASDLGVRYVAARREDAAVGMADGWARRSGRVGVATVTHGPGLTNAVTSLVESVKANTPLVLLTALTPAAARHHPQRIDAAALVAATGAAWHLTRGPAFIAADVFEVFHRAATERRPQVLAIPVEQLYADVTGLLLSDDLPESLPVATEPSPPGVPDQAAIDRVAGLVAEAKRPVIVGGRGAAAPDAAAALARLSERLGAPLATTLVANGLFAGHPNAIGICGGFATDRGGEIITDADLVLAFGCSLNPYTTMNGDLLAGSVVVQCDTDPGAFGAWMHPDVAVTSDSGSFADALAESVAEGGAWAPEGPDHRDVAVTSETAPFVTLDVARRLGEVLPSEGITHALDAGHAIVEVVPHLRPASPQQFVFGIHLGSIGLGLGLATGAAVAGGEWTVLVVGDGALAMSLQDLDTIRRENLPVLILVLDDGGYGAEVHYSANRGIPDEHAYIDAPSFVDVASAFGFDAREVETLDGLDVIGEILAGPPRPALVHIPIRAHPMNRWYQAFSAQVTPVTWTGFAAG